jgi:hypothetical protein
MFTGDDNNWNEIEQLKKDGKYVFATCYDVEWGFILPCESGVVWEQQTEGVCCHHVYIEGVLIPLKDIHGEYNEKEKKYEWLFNELSELNYKVPKNYKIQVKDKWDKIHMFSHIDFVCINAPPGMPRNQEAFQWIKYYGHEEGWGNSFSIESWKDKPIVLVYPNSD